MSGNLGGYLSGRHGTFLFHRTWVSGTQEQQAIWLVMASDIESLSKLDLNRTSDLR